MKAKFLVVLLGLVFCLCVFLVESKFTYAEEWTAEQKEIVDWFKKYTEVSIEGNLEGIWSYYHPKFSGWDFSQTMHPVPFDKAWLQKNQEGQYEMYKMISFEVEPLKIKVEGNYAIIHVNYIEKVNDSEGNEITFSGPWTSALIKQDGKWLFISWSYKVSIS
jgi:ketosteroid isomerase-like protein